MWTWCSFFKKGTFFRSFLSQFNEQALSFPVLETLEREKTLSCKLPKNQTGCHFAVRLWSVLDFMSLFLRRKMEQFSLPQSVPYEQPPNIFKLKSSGTLTHIQRESGTVTRKRKKEKAVRMCAQRPALSPSPASGLITMLLVM